MHLKSLLFPSAMMALAAACAVAPPLNSTKEGLVEYVGAQRDIFKTGKAASVIALSSLEGRENLYAVGPVEGLDGEITIFGSLPFVSQVRGNGFTVDDSFRHGAFFLVWAQNRRWVDRPVPPTVRSYLDLQKFVKAEGLRNGIDVSNPFPFLLSGRAEDIKWHTNVDLTEGKPINAELFRKSKKNLVLAGEAIDIIGFFSERHAGIFMSQGISQGNDIHIHFVSRDSKATGHIDDIALGKDMMLRLPQR